MTALAIVFWVSAGLLLYSHVGYPLLLALLARLRAGRDAGALSAAAAPSELPSRVGDRRRVRRAGRDRRAGREPARRSTIRPTALEVIVACDGSPDATAERARDAGRRPRARAPAGRQDPRPGRGGGARRGEIVAFSDANATLGAGRAAAAGRAVRRSAGRLRVRRRPLRQRPRHQPGGAVLALRDGAALARVAAALGDRRQRRDLRDPPRGLPGRRPDHGPRPLVPVQHGQARMARACTRRTRARARRWSPRSRASSRASGG